MNFGKHRGPASNPCGYGEKTVYYDNSNKKGSLKCKKKLIKIFNVISVFFQRGLFCNMMKSKCHVGE